MILVTGGTGLVGIHLLMELSEKESLPIRATYRSTAKKEKAKSLFTRYFPYTNPTKKWNRIEWIEADITNIPALNTAFNGITEVYHCAGYITFDPKEFNLLKKINIEGTANMVNCALSNSISKFCYISSIASLNLAPGEEILNEDSNWNPDLGNSAYAISKFGGEMEVWRGMEEGLNAVIVNPGVIIGPGFYSTGSGTIFPQVKKGIPFYTKGGTGYIGVWDTVKIMHALMQKNSFKERFVLIAENLSNKTVIESIATTLKTKIPKKTISKKWVVLYALLLKIKSFFNGKAPVLSSDMVDNLYVFSKYENTKITKLLNWEFTPMKNVFRETALNYKNKR